MNRHEERFLKKAIKTQIASTKSLNKKGSRSWYAEDLTRCLHKSLRHYNDVKSFCDANPDAKIYGVYLRYEMMQNRRVKIGKGVAYLYNGISKLTRDHSSATENPLETDVFIPCVDEASALTLEDALHRYFGKTSNVHQAIANAYNIINTRWLKPATNSDGGSGGEENFDFENIWEDRISVFTDAVEEICRQKNVNVKDFAKLARENSQVKGSDLMVEWLLNGNDMKDFYLLMKPRAGKNTTLFFGIAKYIKALKERNEFDRQIIIDFISLWPSAFEGAKNDLDDYYYLEDIVIAGVDTGEEGWQERLEILEQDINVDAVFRFCSMQSIDMSVAKDYNDDKEREGAKIEFESAKCEYFKSNPADLCVIDESDHGMRTKRSTDALELFGYTRRIWMSGTDLYALRQEVRTGNHFLYDIFDEIQDIKAGNIDMPRMRKYALQAGILPLEDYDASTMDDKELTRKLVAVFETTKQGDWEFDKRTGRFVDAKGNQIKFNKFGEVQRLWKMIYFWDVPGQKSPEDHEHIFCCMPSVPSCLALYNHIKDGDLDCQHEPLTANTFASANRIERQVNDAMVGKRTIFLTVGRMLRGAKAPWSAVVRFDSYSDFKIGLQLELRGQNTTEDWFDVYDANVFRSSKMQYDLIRSRTNGGKINSTGKKLHDLIPMYRKGEFETVETTWDDIEADYFAGNVVEGMKRRNLLDRNGLINAESLLTNVEKAKTAILTDKDAREGKQGSSKQTAPVTKGEKDVLEELIKKGLTVSSMLPILMELTNYQYTDIDELIDAVPNDIYESWLTDKCGVEL